MKVPKITLLSIPNMLSYIFPPGWPIFKTNMTSLFERVSYRNTHLCKRIPLKLPHTMILGSCKNSQNYWSGSIKLFDRLIRVDDVSGDDTEYLLAIRKIVEILAIKRKTIMIHQTLREEYRNEYRKIQTRKKTVFGHFSRCQRLF